MTKTGSTANPNVLKESEEHLLSVSFSKTSSKNYPLAVSLLDNTIKHQEKLIGKRIVHHAVFSKDPDHVAAAIVLLRLISGWKDTVIYAGGKKIQRCSRMEDVLSCYLEASGCNDHRAHCYQIINDPYSEHSRPFYMNMSIKISLDIKPDAEPIYVDRYIFPCALLYRQFKLKPDHPSSPQDQIQAEAVSKGIDICPLFNAENFKNTGKKTEIRH